MIRVRRCCRRRSRTPRAAGAFSPSTPRSRAAARAGDRGCAKPGKHPRTENGLADATTDRERIAAWWTRWPDANVAILTGHLVVIDVDGPDGPDGRAALAALERDHEPLPATLRARTHQGEHLYFTAPDDTIACSVGRLGRGLDVRGRGGYAIAPPSQHHHGQRYRWTHHGPAAPLPAWLAALLTPPAVPERSAAPPAPALVGCSRSQRYLHAALAGELADVAGAQPGTRNDTLNRAAFRLGQLAASGLATLDELAPQLLDAARHAGLPDSEATATIASGLTAGHQHPRPREVPR